MIGRSVKRRLLVALAVAVVAGPILASVVLALDPYSQDLADRFAGPSRAHLLGTDHLGRDLLSRLLVGARLSIGLTLVLVATNAISGTVIGMIAASRGGVVAAVVERVIDVMVAVPSIAVGLLLAAILEPGMAAIGIAVALGGWMPYARLGRNLTQSALRSGWATASVVMGGSRWHVVRHSVLPNTIRPIVAHTCLRTAQTLLGIAGLTFIGLGVQPPTPELGVMVADGMRFANRTWRLVALPAAVVVGVALVVGSLERVLDDHWDSRAMQLDRAL
ncbi:MAG: ABC transporter permease [Ilumatobacteraceae bacterium]